MMLVMRIGHVRVPVPEAAVPMWVCVRLARWVIGAVLVLMMRIMHMGMRVREHLVLVFMFMIFGEMQPHPNRHQGAGNA